MKTAALLAVAHDAGVGVRLDGQGHLRLAYRADADPGLLDQLRTHKASIVEHLTSGHMPRGYGRCPACREFGWLPEGPEDGVCDACARLLADEGEVGLHGRPLP